MEESGDSMKPESEVIKVPSDRIHPNSWNPFSMKPEPFEALVKHVQKEGLLGQIVVRPCQCSRIEGVHYEIIDGENRWMVAQDRRVDIKEMVCLVEDKDDIEARLETINFNLEHGEIVQEKFQALIKDIETRAKLSIPEIAGRLFLPSQELALRITPVNVKVDQPRIDLQAKLPTFTISARMHSRKDYDYVDSILRSIMREDECDEASALLADPNISPNEKIASLKS